MERKIIQTEDGSKTLIIPQWNETYHSRYGAIQESMHVFIRNGLNLVSTKETINILEIGFGTGLNAFITLIESAKRKQKINYLGIEKYPLNEEEFSSLNYSEKLQKNYPEFSSDWNKIAQQFQKIFTSPWEEEVEISDYFTLKKHKKDFLQVYYPSNEINLIYFDAFGAEVQPELWTENLLGKLYNSLKEKGILTTYAAKGSLRRALVNLGFRVEKRPGALGKREMLVAFK